jgi:hypothetical protein
MPKIQNLSLILPLAALITTTPALAASEEAWLAFRQDVSDKCLALATQAMSEVEIRVDPFGTETHGVALITGLEDGASAPTSRICIMSKVGGLAELGNPLPPLATGRAENTLSGTPPVPAAEAPVVAATCDAACEETAAILAPEDAQSLNAIAATMIATLEQTVSQEEPAQADAARIADLLTLDMADMDFTAVSQGQYRCRVYWYGFLDQGMSRIASHRCEIGEEGDAMRVRKISGERMDALLLPWGDDARAFVGRTFLPGHDLTRYDAETPANPENENFGNKVGLAFAHEGNLYLASTQARGMDPVDDTFFEVIELVPDN